MKFLNHHRSVAKCLVAFMLLATGCFGSGAQSPSALSLPSQFGSNDKISVQTLSTSPTLFKVSVATDNAKEILFATALKQCGIKEFVPSKATTRELFVGFEKLTVNGQEFIEQDNRKIFRSELTAVLDDQPVSILSYTLRRGDCVSDFAFWKNSNQVSDLRNLVEPDVLKELINHD